MQFPTRIRTVAAFSALFVSAAACSGGPQTLGYAQPASSLVGKHAYPSCTNQRKFVSDVRNSAIYIYSNGVLCGIMDKTQGLFGPAGLAVDFKGNLWVANYYGNSILEFASPYTGQPIKTLPDSFGSPYDVVVCKGYIAATNTTGRKMGSVTIYRNGTSYQLEDTTSIGEVFAACDPSGNLFVDGLGKTTYSSATEWVGGKKPAISLEAVGASLRFPGGVKYDAGLVYFLDQASGVLQGWQAPFQTPSKTIKLQNTGEPNGFAFAPTDEEILVADGSGFAAHYDLNGKQTLVLYPPLSGAQPTGAAYERLDAK